MLSRMRPIQTFQVRPVLPEPLRPLEEIALNLRWSWDPEAISLFRRLDRDLWEETHHNPALLLATIAKERLREAARDESFLAQLDRVARDLSDYLASRNTWHRNTRGESGSVETAYFCMEYGLTECLPIFSGGLGMLAADHLKSASDLGIPIAGVGLLYQKGYFQQSLDPEGWQRERYPVNDFATMPVRALRDEGGAPLTVRVDIGDREVEARLWRIDVGRVPLILLDTNLPGNPPDLRDLTDDLYGGGPDHRLDQEILLGVGGVRALRRVGIAPRVFHINEGHCAFLVLERIRELMEDRGLAFAEAREVVAASTVFTTHTPVPAGIDEFPPEMAATRLARMREALGLSREEFLDLGRLHPGRSGAPLNMAVLALRTSSFVNGVSRLHGAVARSLWRGVWPDAPPEEIPIGHVTNGVHAETWISVEMRTLLDRYLGPSWPRNVSDPRTFEGAARIPAAELWRTHERRRERLVAFARARLAARLKARGALRSEIESAREALDPEALTIGFARRFATYKRATLLLTDPDRLERILTDPRRPVQIIWAGKAHPRDDGGKDFIRRIVQFARRPGLRGRVVFLENYDPVIARYLVQGADLWLNTPRRPLEASGTSGMKAALNGGLNLSIPDGWWDEAKSPDVGWTIGTGETYDDPAYQDRVEANTIYDLLEREIVPRFYDRGSDGMPHEWIEMMKASLRGLGPVFNTHRMLQEYDERAYHPALVRRARLEEEDHRRARELARWWERVRKAWPGVAVGEVSTDLNGEIRVGASFTVRALVKTGGLSPEDLEVAVYRGRVADDTGEITGADTVEMAPAGEEGPEGLPYAAEVPCEASGRRGFTVRVLPRHEDLPRSRALTLVRWPP